MIKRIVSACLLLAPLFTLSQNNLPAGKAGMTPELLWKLGRVTGLGISKDGKYIVYTVSTPDVESNKSKRKSYILPVNGGSAIEISNPDSILNNKNLSDDGKYLLSNKEVKLKKVSGN